MITSTVGVFVQDWVSAENTTVEERLATDIAELVVVVDMGVDPVSSVFVVTVNNAEPITTGVLEYGSAVTFPTDVELPPAMPLLLEPVGGKVSRSVLSSAGDCIRFALVVSVPGA